MPKKLSNLPLKNTRNTWEPRHKPPHEAQNCLRLAPRRGIEPLSPEWESGVLTARRTGQMTPLLEGWEVKEGKLFMCLELSIYKKCPIHSRSNIILHLSIWCTRRCFETVKKRTVQSLFLSSINIILGTHFEYCRTKNCQAIGIRSQNESTDAPAHVSHY